MPVLLGLAILPLSTRSGPQRSASLRELEVTSINNIKIAEEKSPWADDLEKRSDFSEGISPHFQEDEMKTALKVTVLSVLSLTINCGDSTDLRLASAVISTNASAVTILNPVKIAVMLDKTGSMDEARTPQTESKDFDPLMDLLLKGGGEFALGVIRDTTDIPLARLYIEAPPIPPTAPSEEGNRFVVADRMDIYQKELASYKKQIAKWENEAKEKISTFRNKLRMLAIMPINAPNTDLYGAVERAELFLSEPDMSWPRPPRRYLVLETDGLDNVQKKPIVVRSGAKIIVVNGTGSLGALAPLNPTRFESLEAALRFVVADTTAQSVSTTVKATPTGIPPSKVRYSLVANPQRLTKSEVRNLAQFYNLMQRWHTNPHLQFEEGDISYWYERNLSEEDLKREFESRRIILERAEKSGEVINTQGDLSHKAELLQAQTR